MAPEAMLGTGFPEKSLTFLAYVLEPQISSNMARVSLSLSAPPPTPTPTPRETSNTFSTLCATMCPASVLALLSPYLVGLMPHPTLRAGLMRAGAQGL